jgi:hypothetical protein
MPHGSRDGFTRNRSKPDRDIVAAKQARAFELVRRGLFARSGHRNGRNQDKPKFTGPGKNHVPPGIPNQ